jgi:phage tail-like protein
MANVTVSQRNPLRTYQFRVAVFSPDDPPPGIGDYVAGVKSVSGLRAQVTPWETWEGGNNLHRYANPSKVIWEPVTLESGLALDDTFERWAQAVLDFAATGQPADGEAVKRHVIIDVWDENMHPNGPPAPAPPASSSASGMSPFSDNPEVNLPGPIGARYRRYHLINAWVSKYQPLPKLDAMTAEVALLSVELIHEGFVTEPIQ